MSRIKHSKEDMAEAAAVYGKKGCDLKFLRGYYRVSYPVLRKWLEDAGREIANPGRWDAPVDHDQIWAWHKDGISQREMARRLDVSRSVIRLRLADIDAGLVDVSE